MKALYLTIEVDMCDRENARHVLETADAFFVEGAAQLVALDRSYHAPGMTICVYRVEPGEKPKLVAAFEGGKAVFEGGAWL